MVPCREKFSLSVPLSSSHFSHHCKEGELSLVSHTQHVIKLSAEEKPKRVICDFPQFTCGLSNLLLLTPPFPLIQYNILLPLKLSHARVLLKPKGSRAAVEEEETASVTDSVCILSLAISCRGTAFIFPRLFTFAHSQLQVNSWQMNDHMTVHFLEDSIHQ